jgi:pyruvate/2-oxoglutarate dehydrogenase complex dihydrolipoamide dehydrogenase (E3) component/3-hydroxyisobutyrate dehydrogenase-like beta-hydroxyacid dehydrogenase
LEPKREKCKPFARKGARVAKLPADAVRDTNLVMYSLSDDDALEKVVFGEEGILSAITAGQVVVDMSTVLPASSLREQEAYAKRGVDFLDAPVFGSKDESAEGKLWVLAAGKKEVFEKVKPVLEKLGQTVHYLGKSGNATAMKLVGNLIVALELEALAEGLVLAQKAGLNPKTVMEVVKVADFRSLLLVGSGENILKVHLDHYRTSGAELIWGNARFIGPRTLQVALRDGGELTLTGERVFVNVGTHAAIPDIPGLAEAKPMTHIEVLDLQRLPEHLIVLGGGYVGVELAQAMRRFGSRVTLIAREPQLAPKEDADFAHAILELFGDEGIEVLLRTQVLRIKGISGERVILQIEDEAGTRTMEGTDILAALGRVPNTQGIGLEKAGIEVTEAAHIRVNDRLETTAPNVWAVGECAGSPYFTHVSENDFHIIHANLNGGNRTTRDRLVPYCLFIDPPLGRVGINESQARANNISYRVASLPMKVVFRPQTLSETRGFMKVMIDAHSDRILGFAALGPEAGELMGNVQVAMLAGLPYTLLRDAVFTHPTMTEGLGMLFARVPKA